MRVHCEALQVKTSGEFDVIDVTSDVEKAVVNSEIDDGYVLVFSRHTTFAILLNEKESGLLVDASRLLSQLVPACNGYLHDDFEIRTENMHPDEPPNAQAHLRQILAGHSSEYIPVANRALMLGTWQRIMLVEFDRPREREVLIQVCGICRRTTALNGRRKDRDADEVTGFVAVGDVSKGELLRVGVETGREARFGSDDQR